MPEPTGPRSRSVPLGRRWPVPPLAIDPRLRELARRPVVARLAIAAVLVLALLGTLLLRSARPWFDHAYLIVMENKSDAQILGDTVDAPYVNGLASAYGVATAYQAVAHTSQGNYLTLVAGTTFGIRDNAAHAIDGPSIFDQLEASGRTWHVYAQDYPGDCFTGASAVGGPDLGPAGRYVRSHDPAISFTRISHDPARCAHITDLSAFDPAAADFELIVPNLLNDMHDGTIKQGDTFLASIVPRILGSPAFAHGVLFITWDESMGDAAGGGKVPLIVVRPGLGPGFSSPRLHTHRALLRTLEDGWGLGCLAGACAAPPMDEFFGQ